MGDIDNKITAAHFLAGTLGLAFVRQWYVGAPFNQARLAEPASLIAPLSEFRFHRRFDAGAQVAATVQSVHIALGS